MSAIGAPGASSLRAGVEVEGARKCVVGIQFKGVLNSDSSAVSGFGFAIGIPDQYSVSRIGEECVN
jgi:hypothetical protein